MKLIVQDNPGVEFEKAPEGNHIAVCYLVVDLGMQESAFQGDIKTKPKIRVSWELPGELMADGRPFSVSKTYTASLNEKAALRQDLESWRGRAFTKEELAGFDVFNIAGFGCMVSVIHNHAENGNTYVNVKSVASLPKGMQAPPLVNQIVKFSLSEFDAKVFDSLPDWLQAKINTRGVHQAPRLPETMSPNEIPRGGMPNNDFDSPPFPDDDIGF